MYLGWERKQSQQQTGVSEDKESLESAGLVNTSSCWNGGRDVIEPAGEEGFRGGTDGKAGPGPRNTEPTGGSDTLRLLMMGPTWGWGRMGRWGEGI